MLLFEILSRYENFVFIFDGHFDSSLFVPSNFEERKMVKKKGRNRRYLEIIGESSGFSNSVCMKSPMR